MEYKLWKWWPFWGVVLGPFSPNSMEEKVMMNLYNEKCNGKGDFR